MKKFSTMFTLIAFTLALGAALAFNTAPRVDNPAWINTSTEPIVCEPASVICGGGNTLCQKFVPEAGSIQNIYHLDEETFECDRQLRMD